MELCDHVNDCLVCADVHLVAHFLQQQVELAKAEPVLPSAQSLWWKSQLRAKQKAVEQATRPITLVRKLAYLVCGVTLLLFIVASAPAGEWLANVFKDPLLLQAVRAGHFRAFAIALGGGSIMSALLASIYMLWIENRGNSVV